MNATPDMLTTTLKMLAALALVLAGLGAFFYFSKRVLQKNIGASGGKMIRVLASQYIGLKKNIALVEVPGAILVVGIAGDTIRLLTKIDDPAVLDKIHDPTSERITPSFSDHLNKLTRRFSVSKNGE
ncbi:MAG: flagellar biosynthetic protein FliO [Deltaproteobacteria bacterium]|jgi:flagellar biogenesis protein FliO|nr:flagellar biosynthetic protein FliO [Deltaproteobacteria bacterium]MBW2468230.1 flagellar biosynthetic protein FliO [Deltaproteobacteria bacterium]MBW2486390.1 flagellar biosynthetic protein FliO [Deltaproteobacteria bacterium]MBW2518140.1 flagellar biosynthetic protein FliO [Deltaproteobacteria bacterium]